MKKINKSFLYKFSSLCIALGRIHFLSWTLYAALWRTRIQRKIKITRPQAKHTLFQLWSFFLKNNLNFKTIKFISHYTFKNKISSLFIHQHLYIIQTDSTIFSFCTITQFKKLL